MPISTIPARVRVHALTRCATILATAWTVAATTFVAVWLALPSTASAATGASKWLPPVPGTLEVVAAFDPPAQNWLAGHRGVDLAASAGTPVRAAGAGVVTFAGTVAGRGVVTVTHSSGRTTYEPIAASVERGQTVMAGESIGVTSGGGHCSGWCLHWGYIKGETYLDPLSLLDLVPPVLKPLGVKPRSLAGGSQRGSANVGATRSVPHEPVATTARGSKSSQAAQTTPLNRTAVVSIVMGVGLSAVGATVMHRRRRGRQLRR
ncbi:MAG: M23 family metallopeptidase [Candidatus Nanopelagicales bacterium]